MVCEKSINIIFLKKVGNIIIQFFNINEELHITAYIFVHLNCTEILQLIVFT